ncbi:GerAB/ArcD/ProY family transporter [Paenibacillus mendelii]|uniref:Endospore germination permease n=1 Tax=Paenibacillus mendelii TaxID=206163 RepID=A0ABV6JLS5_9BACL|nr:endospore germination permease [Paenibacillus mendelii]MCQ6560663.1 endospore germination permease [Paenibacillus mendelii]
MHSRRDQISIWLAFSILLLSSGLVSHVQAIPILLGTAGRDAWIAVLVGAPIFLLWILMFFGILRYIKGKRLTDWIGREYGAFVSWVFRISSAILLFSMGTYTLEDTSTWAVVTYMQQTPLLLIVLVGVLVSALAACRGIHSIAMTSSILLPVVILLGYFVMSANQKYKNYHVLFPVMEHGWMPVIQGAFYSMAALMEMWVLMLFQHKLSKKLRWWQMLLLGLFLIMMTLGPTIGAITEFGPMEAAKQRNTAFEQWKILRLGQLFQHVDFLSIYQWMCGSFARVALSLYLIPDLLNIRKPVKRNWTILGVAVAMSIIAIQPWSDSQRLDYITHIQFPISFFFIVGSTLLLAIAILIKQLKQRKIREASSNEKAG